MKKFIIVLALFLAGCASEPDIYGIGSMLPGRLISLADGHVLAAQLEITPIEHPVGKITAVDTATGENFNGTYTIIVETKVVQTSTPGFLFDNDTGQAVQTSDVAPGTAVLVGDKGTVINLKITVKSGHPPVGYGDGEDNKGKKYTLQF